jgi:hypothetical protein
MKLVAMFLVAAFVVAVGTSFAFGDCAGHNKAQLVKNQSQSQEQLNKEQPAGATLTVAEKAAETVAEKATEPAKPAAKTPEKK